jgi:hypothetical protein
MILDLRVVAVVVGDSHILEVADNLYSDLGYC